MIKYTQKQLKDMVKEGIAVDVTRYGIKEADALREKEGWLKQVGYSSGVYGCNGQLWQGNNTKTLYAITSRTTAIYLF